MQIGDCWFYHAQVRNALAKAAVKTGAGLLEVLLPLQTLQQGAKAIYAAFQEALDEHRCGAALWKYQCA